MSFQIALHAANVLLQNALGVLEGIVDRRMNIGVALVGVRLVADIDLLSIRQGEVDMDLEEAAGPAMLPGSFTTTRQAVIRPYRFSSAATCRAISACNVSLGGHALKIDVQRGFHLWLLDHCSAGVRARGLQVKNDLQPGFHG